jgi:hypothetical protein
MSPFIPKLLLDMNGKVLIPQEATLSLNFATDTWDENRQAWVYGEGHICPHWQIDVRVAADPDADWEIAPMLTYLIPHQVEIPPLGELPGLEFSDLENQRCEAWTTGNDGAAIVENVLRFGPWVDLAHIEIEWTGKYHDWGTKRRDALFRLAGVISFSGITARVREETDAARFLKLLIPRADPAMFFQEFESRPPGFEADPHDRLYRLPVRWARTS